MPGTITRLEVQKRNKERVNVYLDDEFALGVALLIAAKLHKGQYLTDEDIERLRAEDGVQKAYDRALNYLSFRPRSEVEIRQYLRGKEVADDAVEHIVGRLRGVGLINDEQFAELWVANRAHTRPRGARALRQELRQKGVAAPVIEKALEDLDEAGQALEVGRQRARRFADLPAQDFQRKLGDFLMRRGFAYDVVRDTVRQLWRELTDEALEMDTDE